MQVRSVSVEERAALQELEAGGPSRSLTGRVRGRLALYGMIDEGPCGWSITALGRKVLRSGRVVPLSPEQLLFSVGAILATAENAAWADGEECLALDQPLLPMHEAHPAEAAEPR